MINLAEFVEYRQYLYFLAALIAFLWSMAIVEVRNDSYLYRGGQGITIGFILIFICLVGLRAFNVGADTSNYEIHWDQLTGYSSITSDYLFYYLMYYIKVATGDYQYFLFAMSLIFFIPFYLAIRNFSRFLDTSIIFFYFIFVSMFFFSSVTINVMRQGAAISLLFYAYSVYLTQAGNARWIKIILAGYVAYSFHSTSLIPIGIMIGSILAINIKMIYYYLFYVLGILASLAGIGIQLLGDDVINLGGRDRTAYIGENEEDLGYEVGFKLRFVVFNTIFLVIFHYLLKLLKEKDPELAYYYRYLMIYYIVSSVTFYMFFYVKFSDRVGLYPWFAIPILFSPVFSKNVRLGTTRILGVLFLVAIFFVFQYK